MGDDINLNPNALLLSLIVTAGMLTAGLTGYAGWWGYQQAIKPSPAAIAQSTARRANQTLPRNVNPHVRLNRAVALADGTLVFEYTTLGIPARAISTARIRRTRRYLMHQLCAARDHNILAKGVAVGYRYYGENGGFIDSFKIAPDACLPR